jgi:hypothetical protein
VGRVSRAEAFFKKNSHFKMADKALRRLKDTLRRAMGECEHEFAAVLQAHSKPVRRAHTRVCVRARRSPHARLCRSTCA